MVCVDEKQELISIQTDIYTIHWNDNSQGAQHLNTIHALRKCKIEKKICRKKEQYCESLWYSRAELKAFVIVVKTKTFNVRTQSTKFSKRIYLLNINNWVIEKCEHIFCVWMEKHVYFIFHDSKLNNNNNNNLFSVFSSVNDCCCKSKQ